MHDTSITIGLDGETERSAPLTVTPSGTPGGTSAIIGTFAMAPGRESATGSIKVAMWVFSGGDVERDCVASKNYAGCIVAGRRVSFVKHRGLTVPIEMLFACSGVPWDDNSTCSRAGKCVNFTVDGSSRARV